MLIEYFNRTSARPNVEMGKCRKWANVVTEEGVSDNDTLNRTWQSTESLLGHELKPDTAIRITKGFVFASFRFCLVGGVSFWWSHAGIEIPYIALFPLPISHPNPIKTQNPAPTSNWNSRFSPLFSAQIPNITAKKGQIPRPAKPIGDHPCSVKGGPYKQCVCLWSKYEEMYGRILKSLNIVNLYRGMSKLKLKINVKLPQLLCITVYVALNGEFERFAGFCCWLITYNNSQQQNPANRSNSPFRAK